MKDQTKFLISSILFWCGIITTAVLIDKYDPLHNKTLWFIIGSIIGGLFGRYQRRWLK